MSSREIRYTACNRDCPDACRLAVEVADNRAIRIGGDPEDPVTRGFVCERTRRFLHRQYAPDRFPGPMLRRDGKLARIGWDAALDLAAEKLEAIRRRHGPAAILHYRSGGSLGILKGISDAFFARFGPVTAKTGDICSGAGETAQILDFGVSESHDLFDLLNSRLILLWGKNPHTSGVHLLPVLREAQARGALLFGLDLRRTKAAALCDEFQLVRPGGDFALAMAAARRILEQGAEPADIADWTEGFADYRRLVLGRSLGDWAAEAGVAPEVATRIGDLLIERRPASIQVGWGLGRRRGGCAATRAIDALAALSGNLGREGGGVSFYYGRRTAFDGDFGLGPLPPAPRLLREALLGQEILAARDPAIHAVWVTAGNPVSMLPDSGVVRDALAGRDFVVVVDTHPTDTTDVADLVLPTLTLLEDEDLLGAYGNHYLRASRPVIEAEVEARHELLIFQGLAERLGLGADFAGGIADWQRRAMRRLEGAGVDAARLVEGAVLNPFREPVLFRDQRFPRPGGRMSLVTAAPPPAEPDPDFPLTLLAVSSPKAQSSQWSVDPVGLADELRVHPDSAAGLAEGARVRLLSRRGELVGTLRLDPEVGPGIVHMPKGGMLRDGCCPNLLVRALETDDGGGAAYYDEPVRLLPLPS